MGTTLTAAQRKALGIEVAEPEKKQERIRGSIPTEYNGRTYASKAEAAYAKELDQQLALGLISEWKPQVRYSLTSQDAPFKVSYVADFCVYPTLLHPLWDGPVAIDVKGYETEIFTLKARIFVDRYPLLPLWVVKKGVPSLYVDTQKRKKK